MSVTTETPEIFKIVPGRVIAEIYARPLFKKCVLGYDKHK